MAFRWPLCCQVPLTMDEFILAVSTSSGEEIELSKEILLALCLNFIVHDDNMNVFRFAHLLVHEYLESKENYEVQPKHATVAFSCLSCLTVLPRTKRYSLHQFEYAYFGWVLHSAMSCKHRLDGRLGQLFRQFLGSLRNPSSFFLEWAEEIEHH